MIRYFLFAIAISIALLTATVAQPLLFISTKNQTFQLNKRPYYFVGTNYWYGSLLGLEKDKTRGVQRLRNELDFLKANGVTNLRLMAGAEGSGMINGVERVGPALQTERGKFDASVLNGLDLVLAEMGKRGMTAVIFFSNNWEWSGGFLQYVIWREIVPPDMRTQKLTWNQLRDMGARFYVCSECREDYLKQVLFVMERTNTFSGVKYTDDPTIMAWEIANEPRPMRPGANELYAQFIRDAAAEIKSRDKNHLVTIGHEGSIGTESMELFERVHSDPNIDYLTIHIWPKNLGWMENAVGKSVRYIEDHIKVAERLKKPLVIEEFGFPRDAVTQGRGDAGKKRVQNREEKNHPVTEAVTPLLRKEGSLSSPVATQIQKDVNFIPGSPTSLRDAYYRKIFLYVGKDVAGANFWAFGGTARPIEGQVLWKRGDEWMGDPPMEEQGLNSVFDVDRSTWEVIRDAARSLLLRRR